MTAVVRMGREDRVTRMPATGTMDVMANDADRELEELGRALADVLVTT